MFFSQGHSGSFPQCCKRLRFVNSFRMWCRRQLKIFASYVSAPGASASEVRAGGCERQPADAVFCRCFVVQFAGCWTPTLHSFDIGCRKTLALQRQVGWFGIFGVEAWEASRIPKAAWKTFVRCPFSSNRSELCDPSGWLYTWQLGGVWQRWIPDPHEGRRGDRIWSVRKWGGGSASEATQANKEATKQNYINICKQDTADAQIYVRFWWNEKKIYIYIFVYVNISSKIVFF